MKGKVASSAGPIGLVMALLMAGSTPSHASTESCAGHKATIVGTAADDHLVGTHGVDVIVGLGGADRIAGAGDDDIICAGDGNDSDIYGGPGVDTIYGGAGSDTLHGGGGDDVINGDDGNDVVSGDDGSDSIDGGKGSDSLNYRLTGGVTVDLGQGLATGEGTDTFSSIENVLGSYGQDKIIGDEGANVLKGRGRDDTIDGAGGNDILHGHLVDGGGGDDLLIGTDAQDVLNGGEGSDTLLLKEPATADLGAGTATNSSDTPNTGDDTLLAVENVQGSSSEDVIIGDIQANVLDGGGGNDKLDGREGTDDLRGGPGIDLCQQGEAWLGCEYLEPPTPPSGPLDRGDPCSSPSAIVGTDGDDDLSGTDDRDVICGLGGNDTIAAGEGDDLVLGGDGADAIIGGAGNDHDDGGAGADRIDGGPGWDLCTGGPGDDAYTRCEQCAGTWEAGQLAFSRYESPDRGVFVANADGTHATQVSRGLAWAYDPDWSANGRSIAFSGHDKSGTAIYAVGADGSGLRRVVKKHPSYGPDWSPDGSQLVFFYEDLGVELYNLFRVQSDGTNLREISLYAEQDLHSPTFSPDGKLVAAEGPVTQPGDSYFSAALVMRPSGRHQISLFPDHESYSPAWSPDGEWLAFSAHHDSGRSTEGSGIYLAHRSGLSRIRLTDQDGHSPQWSPDGHRIAFVSVLDGQSEIYVMDADDSHLQRLTNDPGSDYSPRWSPDGRAIAFVHKGEETSDVYIMASDGSNPHPVTNTAEAQEIESEWRPKACV